MHGDRFILVSLVISLINFKTADFFLEVDKFLGMASHKSKRKILINRFAFFVLFFKVSQGYQV